MTTKAEEIADFFEANKNRPLEEVRAVLDDISSKHAEV